MASPLLGGLLNLIIAIVKLLAIARAPEDLCGASMQTSTSNHQVCGSVHMTTNKHSSTYMYGWECDSSALWYMQVE
jgi:hypothetical protein